MCRFIKSIYSQRLLPDKAIDVLDITSAHLSAQNPALDKVETEKRITELEMIETSGK